MLKLFGKSIDLLKTQYLKLSIRLYLQKTFLIIVKFMKTFIPKLNHNSSASFIKGRVKPIWESVFRYQFRWSRVTKISIFLARKKMRTLLVTLIGISGW